MAGRICGFINIYTRIMPTTWMSANRLCIRLARRDYLLV